LAIKANKHCNEASSSPSTHLTSLNGGNIHGSTLLATKIPSSQSLGHQISEQDSLGDM